MNTIKRKIKLYTLVPAPIASVQSDFLEITA